VDGEDRKRAESSVLDGARAVGRFLVLPRPWRPLQ
jgi:hypothetical protein